MKKFGLLTSMFGIATISSIAIPLTSCSCSTLKITWDKGIENVEVTEIKELQPFTITIKVKDGYKIKKIKIKISGVELKENTDYVLVGNVVTVNAAAVTSTKSITIDVSSDKVE